MNQDLFQGLMTGSLSEDILPLQVGLVVSEDGAVGVQCVFQRLAGSSVEHGGLNRKENQQ